MEIIDLSNCKKSEFYTGVALGNFDGIHVGHQNLIKAMVDMAKSLNLRPSLLLFKQHTKAILSRNPPKHITNIDQKIRIAEDLGIELVYTIDFDEKTMKLSPDEFVEKILIQKMKTKLIVVGYDYRFGYKAKGDASYLKELSNKFNFKLKIIDQIKNKGNTVSSSYIRDLIQEGKFREVENQLSRPYSILGKVIKGENRGNKLGFPTANIELIDDYVLPKTGVYKTYTKVDGKIYKSATNIGYNPTFNKENKTLKIETYILDFKENIYGETIEIYFKKHIRDDIKFNNIKNLIEQMKLDIKEISKED